MVYRKSTSGAKVKFDKDPRNDFSDGYNSAVRAAKAKLTKAWDAVTKERLEAQKVRRSTIVFTFVMGMMAGSLLALIAYLAASNR